jgi:hypothetical protein
MMSRLSSPKILSNGLPDIQRLITTHNQDGKAVYADAISEDIKWQPVGEGDRWNFFLAYTTRAFPVDLNTTEPEDATSTPKDLQSYEKDLNTGTGLSVANGE